MKKILLVAVITLWSIAAQAQNKIFEKYAKMEGVEYVCINKAMFSAGLSIATAGQVVVDEPIRKVLTSANLPTTTEC